MNTVLIFEREARRLVMAVRSLDVWGVAAGDKLAAVLDGFERAVAHGPGSPAYKSALALYSIGREHQRLGWCDVRVDALEALAALVEADLQRAERVAA